MTITRRALVAVVAAAVVLAPGMPAGAIETETFGIAADERASGDPGRRVTLAVEPGGAATLHLRVWNKTDAPLSLILRAVPASVGDDGTPQLGGDAEPVGWVSLDTDEVTLGPKRQRIVSMTVDAPAELSGSHTLAVLAAPAAVGEAPAVLERVGVVVELAAGRGGAGAGSSAPLAGVGGIPAVLAAVALAGLGLAGFTTWRLRHRSDLTLARLKRA